eukprot:CAMPEP_0173387982 /NCGR_PEP_ID=MMETSP1356-20130122/10381_1 /TAXON_ID=77927 ORGANISM="Hemiselmis virescens, Strain PCC157" /NCGR_SAMPLE_ID=MMETSP1356 /ASSEMBLY_ACC=CAM_ASM_000847 /LENGTH=250 /DNA_ID=CAMNT_0014344757 /DNA_START=220 /DNA_END=968 /DNA_ORIENTATION=+
MRGAAVALCLALAVGSLHVPAAGQQCASITPTSMPFPSQSCMDACPSGLPAGVQCELGSSMDVSVQGVNYCCRCVERYDPLQDRTKPSPNELRLCPQTVAVMPRLFDEPPPPEGMAFVVYVSFDLGEDTRVAANEEGILNREFLPPYNIAGAGNKQWFKFENEAASREGLWNSLEEDSPPAYLELKMLMTPTQTGGSGIVQPTTTPPPAIASVNSTSNSTSNSTNSSRRLLGIPAPTAPPLETEEESIPA